MQTIKGGERRKERMEEGRKGERWIGVERRGRKRSGAMLNNRVGCQGNKQMLQQHSTKVVGLAARLANRAALAMERVFARGYIWHSGKSWAKAEALREGNIV